MLPKEKVNKKSAYRSNYSSW